MYCFLRSDIKLPFDTIIRTIPRSREVGQSYLSSIQSTLRALLHSLSLVLFEQPSLLLVNGPGPSWIQE